MNINHDFNIVCRKPCTRSERFESRTIHNCFYRNANFLCLKGKHFFSPICLLFSDTDLMKKKDAPTSCKRQINNYCDKEKEKYQQICCSQIANVLHFIRFEPNAIFNSIK